MAWLHRQQIKWIAFGVVLALSGGLATLYLLPALLQWPQMLTQPLGVCIVGVLLSLCLALFFCSLAFALLRYRLEDIDLLINRTIVYSLVTLLLILLYLFILFFFQTFLRRFAQISTLALIGSTILAVLLFYPLRLYVQAVVDRSLYRSRYRAVQTLKGFTHTLRNEIEIELMREHLLSVVEETMQPVHLSLWLCEPSVAPLSVYETWLHAAQQMLPAHTGQSEPSLHDRGEESGLSHS